MSVAVSEITSVEHLSVVEDNNPFNGHCYIDFTKVISKNQKKQKGR